MTTNVANRQELQAAQDARIEALVTALDHFASSADDSINRVMFIGIMELARIGANLEMLTLELSLGLHDVEDRLAEIRDQTKAIQP